MDKTAEMFRSLHDDRKKLIDQWEESVKNMQTRDRQLENLGEDPGPYRISMLLLVYSLVYYTPTILYYTLLYHTFLYYTILYFSICYCCYTY